MAQLLANEEAVTVDANWGGMAAQDIVTMRFTHAPWRQDVIQMYGKRLPLPRLTCWCGDGGASYTYSCIHSEPQAWSPVLLDLKSRLEALSGQNFNSLLLNWYRNGDSHMSRHADDEVELGASPSLLRSAWVKHGTLCCAVRTTTACA